MWILDLNKKTKKTLAIDSDTESENKAHVTREHLTGESGVTIDCNNLQSVSKIAEWIFWPAKIKKKTLGRIFLLTEGVLC